MRCPYPSDIKSICCREKLFFLQGCLLSKIPITFFSFHCEARAGSYYVCKVTQEFWVQSCTELQFSLAALRERRRRCVRPANTQIPGQRAGVLVGSRDGEGGGGAEARETFQPSFEGVTRLNSIAPPIPLGSDTTAVCLPAHTHINILQRFAVVQVRRGL